MLQSMHGATLPLPLLLTGSPARLFVINLDVRHVSHYVSSALRFPPLVSLSVWSSSDSNSPPSCFLFFLHCLFTSGVVIHLHYHCLLGCNGCSWMFDWAAILDLDRIATYQFRQTYMHRRCETLEQAKSELVFTRGATAEQQRGW